MKPDARLVLNNKIHFGTDFVPIRMQAAASGWLAAGDGWGLHREQDAGAADALPCDGWLVELPAAPDFVAAALASGLPLARIIHRTVCLGLANVA